MEIVNILYATTLHNSATASELETIFDITKVRLGLFEICSLACTRVDNGTNSKSAKTGRWQGQEVTEGEE